MKSVKGLDSRFGVQPFVIFSLPSNPPILLLPTPQPQPHQSHIKHEKLEGIMVFIELERQTWSIIEFVVPFKDIKPYLLPEVQKLVK